MVLPNAIKHTLDALPTQPGVYRLKNSQHKVLYIGKSKNLKKRVRTYFHSSPPDRKVAHLRARTKAIDFLVLESDQQAQEVEWDLIRSHGPPYNTLYLDYWNRPYIKLTAYEPYPRVELTQTKDDPDAEYYGPYKNTRRLRDTLVALRDTFPIRDCKLDISDGGNSEKYEVCMEHHLGRCTAPCVGQESSENYRARLEPIRAFLNGDYGVVLETLTERMNDAVSEHNYEAASIYRDRRQAVKNMVNYEPFLRETLRCDVWGANDDCVVKLTVREHRVTDFTIYHNEQSIINTIQKYYSRVNHYVTDIIVPEQHTDSVDYPLRSPGNKEEQRLVRTAKRTAKFNGSDRTKLATTADVTDHIILDSRRIRITRTKTECETEDRKTLSTRDPRHALKDTILPHYKHDFETGQILPSEVRLDNQSRSTLNAENLFNDCDFWFPILLE